MRILAVWLLAAALLAPALRGFAAAPPDEGVSAAAAAATPEEAANQGARAEEAEGQDLEARLTEVQGPVYVHLADHADDEYVDAEKDMPVAAGDEIRVGEGGSAELTLDGSTVIRLAEKTDFVVNSLAPAATEFHLGLGSLVAKIKHLLDGRRMEFHTPTAVAAVRGTELGVAQGEGGEPSRIGVFDEGKVAVSGANGEGEVRLGPNQEAQVAAGKPVEAPRRLSWWKQGRARIAQARSRQGFMLKNWQARPFAQRRQWRQRLLQRPALKRAALKGLSPQQLRQQYRAQRQRQQILRRQIRAQRQQKMQQQQQQRRMRQRRMQQQPQRRQKAENRPQQAQPRRWQAEREQQQRRERGLARGGRRR